MCQAMLEESSLPSGRHAAPTVAVAVPAVVAAAVSPSASPFSFLVDASSSCV